MTQVHPVGREAYGPGTLRTQGGMLGYTHPRTQGGMLGYTPPGYIARYTPPRVYSSHTTLGIPTIPPVYPATRYRARSWLRVPQRGSGLSPEINNGERGQESLSAS